MRTLDVEERILVAVTVVFAIFGLAFACLGIWCFADTTTLLGYANTFYFNTNGVSLFGLQPGWTLVPCGLLGVPPLILALVATCSPSKSFLVVFIVYVSLLLTLELPMTIAMLASWQTTESTLKTSMETSMKNDYVGMPYSYTHSQANSLLFDKLMVNNKCCGINSNTDFTTNYNTYASVWYNGYRSHTLGNGTGYTTTLPSACCMYNNADTMINNNDWLNYRNYLVNQLCPVNQASSYTAGCFTIVTAYTYNIISVSLGCYFVPILLHVVSIILAAIVYCTAYKVTRTADWSEYSREDRSRRSKVNPDSQQMANGNDRYMGRRGNNPNSYGGGWGSNRMYSRN